MLSKKLFKNTKGDTIIEVLLSVAIMSLILAISYGLANKNSQYVRGAQERGEAQKYAEEQLERLRYWLNKDDDNNGTFNQWSTSFKCLNTSGNPTAIDNQCNFGTDGRYQIRVQVVAEDTYKAHTTWFSPNGNNATLDLSYRLTAAVVLPPLPPPPTPPPPPPTPPYDLLKLGTQFITPGGCFADSSVYVPPGDGFDGCKTNGTSIYAWRPITAIYGLTTGLDIGNATLRIKYRQYANTPGGGGSNTAPPGYNFQLRTTVSGSSSQAFNLPAGSPGTQMTRTFNISIGSNNPSQIRFTWLNDAWPPGYDANLQIDEIFITQPN